MESRPTVQKGTRPPAAASAILFVWEPNVLVVRPPVPWTRCEGMSGHVEHPQKPTSSRRLRIIDLVRPHWKTLSLAPVAVLGETFAVVLELGAARHPASRAPRRRSADLDTRGQGLRQGRLRATALRLREPDQRRGGTRGPKHQGQAVPLVEVIVAIGTCLVLWYGARLALAGQRSAGVLIAFLLYLRSKRPRNAASGTPRARATRATWPARHSPCMERPRRVCFDPGIPRKQVARTT